MARLLGMPPLVAVTHSLLILEDGFEPKLLACAKLLLDTAPTPTLPGQIRDVGTLAHASLSDPEDPAAPRDYAGCARVIVAQGVPTAELHCRVFSAEVTEVLARLAHEAGG